jgi:MFS family permease
MTELIERTDANGTGSEMGVVGTWREMPREVKAMLAGVFVSKLAGFIHIYLVLFLTVRGFTSGQAGFALGIYGAGAILGTFVGGYLSDRQSARSSMVISMLGSAVFLVSIVYLKDYLLLLIAIFLVSAISQIYRPAALVMITDLSPADRLVMVTAIYRLCLNLGTGVAPLFGMALASISYNLLFWGEALAALIYCIIALFFLPRSKPTPQAANQKAPGEAATDLPAAERDGGQKRRSGYLALLSDPRYMLFLFGFLCLHLVYIQHIAALPLAIKTAGLSTWWYAVAIALNGAMVVCFEVGMTRVVQKWPLRLSQGLGYGLLALAYGAFSIMVPLMLILGTVLWSLSEIFGAPTVWAYPGMVAPPHLRGRYFGGLYTIYGVGSTIGPIVGIALFTQMGQRFFLLALGLGVVATVIGQLGIKTSAAPNRSRAATTSMVNTEVAETAAVEPVAEPEAAM